ncbi:amino acid permease C-terminal domain-containing protein [Escherichia coli]|uniref:amino acid permease C-terminal domain-containing protein n=1 Tax=Escherichia coli TaxID=562 RepID=UPI0013F67491|nr:amino acid permease C-terminal domain-containing protein [Escherichia coli]QIL68361.1 hypothetical protein F0L67_28500 [Escherichia coli]
MGQTESREGGHLIKTKQKIALLDIIYLRRSDAQVARPFRTPAVPVVPLLGMGFSILLMVFLPWETWLRLIVWLVIGLGLYFAYGRRHSVLLNGEAPRGSTG